MTISSFTESTEREVAYVFHLRKSIQHTACMHCRAVQSNRLPSSRAAGSASISCLSSPHVGILNVLGFEHKPSAE